MLDHSKAEPIGIMMDVLCQLGVTTILAKFLLLDIPVDRDVPMVVGRRILHTCRAIMNTIKGTTSTFDGIVHQKFYVANVRNAHVESDSDDDEEYFFLKRDDMGKPIYGPNRAKYLNCDDPMDRALALQEALNPFKKNCVWKKAIAFLGALPVPLQNAEWIRNHLGNFAKENGDGKWHTKIRVVDPYGNIFEQGYEAKATNRKMSDHYKLSDIMSPNVIMTVGTHDDEAASFLPKRTRVHETVEEAMFPRVHHEFLLWGTSNRSAKTKYNTNLAQLLPKHIYSVYEMGGQEEIFTSEALIRAFDINELIYTELYHEFCSTYEFDEDLYDRKGRIEIRQGTLKRMSRRHSDRYARFFEYMAGQDNISLQGGYVPPGYDEEQQQEE
ncbi:hypothetical protein Tco_0658049 [Tanacetum coccineum]